MPLYRTRSRSSNGTIKANGRRSSPSPSDEDDDDDECDEFRTPGTPDGLNEGTSYDDRLQDLLGDGAGAQGDGDDNGNDDEEEFVYNGVSGRDEELATRRREFITGNPEEDEKRFLMTYSEQMRDILGEEEARQRDEDAGEEEIETIEADRVRDEEEERSDRTTSTASRRHVSTSLSPGAASPTSSLHSASHATRRPAFLHPTVSRLRSHLRQPSDSSIFSSGGSQTQNARAVSSSHFSQLSRSESFSTIHSSLDPSGSSSRDPSFASTPIATPATNPEDPLQYTTLKRISQALYPTNKSAAKLANMGLAVGQGPKRDQTGRPVLLAVGGLVCVGTDRGWVGTWDFRGECKGWYGNDSISRDAGPVTALSISPDYTFIAVGHAGGHIYLYSLASPNPNIPTRTVLPTTLAAVNLGRKEGHLANTRILHLGFVGKRHTAIISGDERGMAFYHSLGRVLGVDSTDVLRILGSYPDRPPSPPPTSSPASSNPPPPPPKRKAITTLFAAAPLPLGPKPHPSDAYQLSALLTPSKLVIVGLKPSPRTWFRRLRVGDGGDTGEQTGSAVWRPTESSPSLFSTVGGGREEDQNSANPVLAFSWGNAVRFIHIRVIEPARVEGSLKQVDETDIRRVEFTEGLRWEAEGSISTLKWVNARHLLILTSTALCILDTRSPDRIERSPLDVRGLVSNDFYSALQKRAEGGVPEVPSRSSAGSLSAYKGKIFLLTKTDVQTAHLISWMDRLLALMELGDILGAIRLATAYYLGLDQSTVLGLPESPEDRRAVVGARLNGLLASSLCYVFSDDRMTDSTHESFDGRGVDRTELFEGLVAEIANACLALEDLDYFFDDVYERYQQAWIDGIFFAQLEPFILEGRIRTMPTNVVQRLFQWLDEQNRLEQLENIIWRLEPSCLDINQAIMLCQQHRLWDALVYVYTRAIRDYVSPVVELLAVVRQIQRHRLDRPQRIGELGKNDVLTDDQVESLVPDAYKLYAYLGDVLSGVTFPSKEPMSEEEAGLAKRAVYGFVFSGRSTVWPEGGNYILTTEPGTAELSYPYLRLLLQFDTEALLHAMDIAFEDPYLNDDVSDKLLSRQIILNILLDVMDPALFNRSDLTLLHIFVARNLPKYPQFILLPPSTLHRILASLASDPDLSTREDRQLAAEYLLSAYTPHDTDAMLTLFAQAGFFRILRSTYKAEQRWASLVSTYLEDPDSDLDVFASVDEILRLAASQHAQAAQCLPAELTASILDAVVQLSDLGVRQTALLIDQHLPTHHADALESLHASPSKQYGYLRCLLEPSRVDEDEELALLPSRNEPCANLDPASRNLYIRLLCQLDSNSISKLLEAAPPGFYDLTRVVEICDAAGVGDAVVYALDALGQTATAFEKVASIIRTRGSELAGGFLALSEGDVGSSHQDLSDVRSVAQMGVQICLTHTHRAKASSSTVNSPEGHPPLEDMWFGLLHELIELVHSVSSILPSPSSTSVDSSSAKTKTSAALPPRPLTTPPPQGFETIVLDSLRSLVQETLTALVSSASSARMSFPRLFKKLVESTTPTSGSPGGEQRAYSEFRAILTGMLDTYRADAELLGVTIRLVERDLFDGVKELERARVRGWRPSVEAWRNGDALGDWVGKKGAESGAGGTHPLKVYRSGEVLKVCAGGEE